MNTTLVHTGPRTARSGIGSNAHWRQLVADTLRSWADRICAADMDRQHGPRTSFVSYREDVRAWCAALSPAARDALGDDRALGKIQRVLHRLRYLPHEETLIDFVRLVPDWDALHHDFASYLLRRLVALRHHGRRPDSSFTHVHAWLRERTRNLTTMPPVWADAVREASTHLVGSSAGQARDAGHCLPYAIVRESCKAST
jgi:hypothetical protein